MHGIQSRRAAGGVHRVAQPAGEPVPPPVPQVSDAEAGCAARFTDNGGPVIPSPHVHLIFWGSAWTGGDAKPSVGAVVDAVSAMVTGPYMDSLAQYRDIGRGSLVGVTLVATSDPPANFSEWEVEDLISGLLAKGSLRSPALDDQLLFLVIAPAKVKPHGNFTGEHSYFISAGVSVHYGWVTHEGDLDGLTTILSHEIVEAATDPEGTGIVGVEGTCCDREGWCEIADVCEKYSGYVQGVMVQAYWSERNHSCVIPGPTSPPV